jgi:hypothetical protein
LIGEGRKTKPPGLQVAVFDHGACLAFRLFFVKFCIFFAEAFNPAGSIYQFLFSGKKRMAFGADFHADICFCGPDLYCVSTSAFNDGFCVFWMDVIFHFDFNPLRKIMYS